MTRLIIEAMYARFGVLIKLVFFFFFFNSSTRKGGTEIIFLFIVLRGDGITVILQGHDQEFRSGFS